MQNAGKVASLSTARAPTDPTSVGEPSSFDFAYGLTTPIWVYDIDQFRIAYANEAAFQLWQADSEADLVARDMSVDMSSTVAKRLEQYQVDFISSDVTFNEMWTLYPEGKPTSVMVHYSGFVLPDGRMAMLCEATGQTVDQPENLRSAEALLHTDVMIMLFAVDGPPLYLNPAARNALADPRQSLATLFVDRTDFELMSFEL